METNSDSLKGRAEGTIAGFFELSAALSYSRNPDAFYRAVHRSLGIFLPVDDLFIALCDDTEDPIRFSYVTGGFDTLLTTRGAGASLIRRVIRFGAPIRFGGTADRAVSGGAHLVCPSHWIGAPLRVRERIIGVVGAAGPVCGHEGLNLLDTFSRHIAPRIEHKEAEFLAQGQRSAMEQILESAPVGIALVQNRVFKWVNAEMVRMFGYASKEDFLDRSVKMIYRAEGDFEFAGRTICEGLVTDGTVDYEMDLMRSDGSLFPIHIRLNAPRDDDPMSWVVGTFTDISKRRAAERKTFEQERLQGVLEMAGAVCHEINQPLQAIIGYSELLSMDPELAYTSNSLKSILSQANRLGKITATLSNITQYKTVEYPGKSKIVDIWKAGSPAGQGDG